MATQDERLNALKQKYQSVLNSIQQQQLARLENVHVENNKLLIRAVAPSAEAKNRIWDQIKLVDSTYSDLTADIRVEQSDRPQTQTAGAAAGGGQRETQSYVVQAGDTLSGFSKRFYGDANQYMRIFEANRDKLKDPNKIQIGQELKIPQ